MPAGAEKAEPIMGNAGADKPIQNLIRIGAIHDHAVTSGPGFHPTQMYHELCRLHGEAIKERNMENVKKSTSQSPTTCDAPDNQRPDRSKDALVPISAQNDHSPSALPTFDEPAMRRWQSEGAYEQPWNPFQLGTGAAYDGQRRK